jgi:hypothetical protein
MKVRVPGLWEEDGECAQVEWFSKQRNLEEYGYVITLFGLLGGILKQQQSCWDQGFVASDEFNQIIHAVNSLDLTSNNDSTNNYAGI